MLYLSTPLASWRGGGRDPLKFELSKDLLLKDFCQKMPNLGLKNSHFGEIFGVKSKFSAFIILSVGNMQHLLKNCNFLLRLLFKPTMPMFHIKTTTSQMFTVSAYSTTVA